MPTIELSAAGHVDALVADLAAARCLARRTGERTCQVTPLEGASHDQALVELRFYVTVWAAGRSGLAARVR
jgi:hypothetical protein